MVYSTRSLKAKIFTLYFFFYFESFSIIEEAKWMVVFAQKTAFLIDFFGGSHSTFTFDQLN